MPTLIHIICALAKCTLSDPSPCKMLQGESGAPVYCRLQVRLSGLWKEGVNPTLSTTIAHYGCGLR